MTSTTTTAVVASAPGYLSAERVLPPSESGRVLLGDVALGGAGSLEVEVVDEREVPVAGVAVSWTEARPADEALHSRVNPLLRERDWVAVGQTGADGGVSVAEVPRGVPLAVRALADGLVPVVERAIAQGFDRVEKVRIRLPVRHLLTIRSRYGAGEAISPVRVVRLDGPPFSRWVRELPNPEGTVRFRLPGGRYEVGVHAARKRLLRRQVVLDGDAEVQLNFHALARVELRVQDPAGNPVPRFEAAFGGPSALDIMNLFLPGNSYPGTSGRVVLELPIPEPDDPISRKYASVVVMAPGFPIGRAEIRSPLDEPNQVATIRLGQGATIRGRVAGLPEGTEVRLYLLRDAAGMGWAASGAPLLATGRAGSGGEVVLDALGAGVYEVRALGPSMELPLAQVTCTGPGETSFEADYLPAHLTVSMPPAEAGQGASAPPVLFPLVSGNKWNRSPDEFVGRAEITGMLKGDNLIFEGLAPGRYLLDAADRPGRAWGPSPDAVRVALGPGESRTVSWSGHAPAVHARFRVSVPRSLGGSDIVFATIPEPELPRYSTELAWMPLASDHSGELDLPDLEPFVLVVGRLIRGSESQGVLREVAPLAFARFPRVVDANGASVVVEEPASLTVRGDGVRMTSLEVTQHDFRAVLRDRWSPWPDKRFGFLMPGRYRVVGLAVGSGDSGARTSRLEASVTLSPGEEGEVVLGGQK